MKLFRWAEAAVSEWISWDEAVEVVARDFPIERAEELLRAAILRGGALEVRTTDQGYTTNTPQGQYVPDDPDYAYFVGEPRAYRKIEEVNLRTLKAWLKGLVSAEPPRVPEGGSPKDRRGGKEKADWDAYREAFAERVVTDGFPAKTNVEGWQRQADVQRWLADLVQRDGYDVAASTLARHAKELMEQYPEHP